METQDEVQQGVQQDVQEVRVHAISLRRPRGKKRAAAAPAPPPATWTTRMGGGLRTGLSIALEPPRQGWLVALGLSSFAVKGTSQAWTALVREGTEAQTQLNRLVADAARRAGLRGSAGKQPKETRRPDRTGR